MSLLMHVCVHINVKVLIKSDDIQCKKNYVCLLYTVYVCICLLVCFVYIVTANYRARILSDLRIVFSCVFFLLFVEFNSNLHIVLTTKRCVFSFLFWFLFQMNLFWFHLRSQLHSRNEKLKSVCFTYIYTFFSSSSSQNLF